MTTTTTTTTTANTSDATPVNVSVFGKTIPILFGAAQVLGAPFWAAPVVTNDDGSRVVTFAAILGRRDPLTDSVTLNKIWMDGSLAYANDGTATNTTDFTFTFYDGGEDQQPDPDIVAQEGAAATPAFRDRMYIVIKDWQVAAGGKFPEVTCEVSQSSNIEAYRYVKPFTRTNGAFAADGAQFVDVALGWQWCVDTTANVIRIFDINTGVELRSVPLKFPPICTGRYTPYYFGVIGDHIAVADLYGNVATSIETVPYGGAAVAVMQAAVPIADGTQFLFATCIGVNVVIARFDPAKFTIALVSSEGIGTVFSGGLAVPATVPTNIVAPNNDYGMAYTGVDRDIAAAIQIVGTSTVVIGTRQCKYTDADGYPGGKTFYDQLTLSTDYTSDVANLDAFFRDVCGEADWHNIRIKWMTLDPVGAQWLGCLFTNTGGGYAYWVKFLTVFSQLGVQTPGHTGSTPNPVPALPTVGYLSLHAYRKLPGLDYINYEADAAVINSLPDTETKVCFVQNATTTDQLVVLDLADGSYVEYPHGDFKSADGSVDYGSEIPFDKWSIWNDHLQCLFYRNAGGTAFTGPGMMSLYQALDNDNALVIGNYLRSLALLAGFTNEQIETENVDDVVVGSILNTPVAFLDLVSAVCDVFRIDIIESEGKLKFKRRVRGPDFAVDRTLTLADLAPLDQSNLDDGTVIQKERDATTTLPSVLQLTYLDSDNDFQAGSQSAKRTIFPVRTSAGALTDSVGVPVAMDSKTALYWAEFCLFDRWAEALKLTMRLPQRHIDLEPGDYLQINTDNYGDYTVKINELDLNADYSLTVVVSTILALPPDNSNLNNIDVASSDTGALPSATQNGVFSFFVLDNLNPNSAGGGGETAATLFVYASTALSLFLANTDNTYNRGATIAATPNGVVLNALNTVPLWALSRPDNDTVINVQMVYGVPTTAADDDAWRKGANAVAIGSPGRWELIFYRTVAKNGDGTYTLSGLLRGQRGTELVDARRAGETAVFVSGASAAPIIYTEYASRVARLVAVYPGRLPTDAAARSQYITLSGGSLKPWAPVQVTATKSGSDIVLSWRRRDRTDLYTGFANGVDAEPAMSETTESYDVEIYAADGTVKRTTTVAATTTLVYTAAQIASDAIDVSVSVHVCVYQLSGVVGRGYGRNIVCPVN